MSRRRDPLIVAERNGAADGEADEVDRWYGL
jgi:hypothetical protein